MKNFSTWTAYCEEWLISTGQIRNPACGEVLVAPLEFAVLETNEFANDDDLDIHDVSGTLFRRDGRVLLSVGNSTFVREAPPPSLVKMASQASQKFVGRISLGVSPYGDEIAAVPSLANLASFRWTVERIILRRNLEPDVPDSEQWGAAEDIDVANRRTVGAFDRCWLQLTEA